MFHKSLQLVKTTNLVFWGKFWRFSVLETFEGIFSCFLKFYELLDVLLTKLYLTYPDEQFDFFLLEFAFSLKFSEFSQNKIRFLAQKFNKFSILHIKFLEEDLMVWNFCVEWILQFSEILRSWAIFLAFLGKKTKAGC